MLFDWFRRRGPVPAAGHDWRVRIDDGFAIVETERGDTFGRAALADARSVRVVPLNRGTHHAMASGWQVCLARQDGDVLLGQPLADWQSAHDLARKLCSATSLPMDELTEKLFSRVGRMQL